ncbi:MAG: hypothetical protein AAB587_00555 [Patescibacteria group bacterium]
MSPNRFSPRNSCKRGKLTKKNARKKSKGKRSKTKQPESQHRVFVLSNEAEKHKEVGDPVPNERAARRRAKGVGRKDPKANVIVVRDGKCIHACGPDKETYLGQRFYLN